MCNTNKYKAYNSNKEKRVPMVLYICWDDDNDINNNDDDGEDEDDDCWLLMVDGWWHI